MRRRCSSQCRVRGGSGKMNAVYALVVLLFMVNGIASRNRDKEEVTKDGSQYSNIEDFDVETGISDPSLFTRSKYTFGSDFESLLSLFGKVSKYKPWWKKESVCVEREEVDDSEGISNKSEDTNEPSFFTSTSINLQTCYQTKSKYECIKKVRTNTMSKTMTVRYQCCPGFQLKNNEECEKVDLLPLVDTIKKLNGTEFLIIARDMEDMFETENLTIFLPSNEAFKNYSNKMLESNRVNIQLSLPRSQRSIDTMTTNNLIESHITKGFQELCPDEMFESLYRNSSLRLKYVYSSNEDSQFLVNCAKILSSNNYATNGIVHTIDRVLMPVTKTIMEIIYENPSLSTLSTLLERNGVAKSLNSNEIWTVFAPTNKAFEKLAKKYPYLIEKLNDGDACILNILKHHMLSHTFCSSAVDMGATGVRNSMGELLKLSPYNKTLNNNVEIFDIYDIDFLINEIKVVESDIIATNGVIHIIEDVIMPDSALPISSLLLKNNLTLFHSLIKKANMLDEINSLSKVTFFIPTDKAIRHHLKNNNKIFDVERFLEEGEVKDETLKEELRAFINHHIMSNTLLSYDLENNAMKDTLSEDAPLRINLYSTIPLFTNIYNRATVDCAKLLHFDMQQCDNILHQIDRPLVPHNATLLELIRNTPQLSRLNELLPGTEMENILENRDNITFVAPINDVFETLRSDDYEMLKKTPKMVDFMLKLHTLKDVVCCAGMHDFPQPFINKIGTLNGQAVNIRNNKVGNAVIVSCDHMANNGVLHFTNKLTIPKRWDIFDFSPNPNVDIMFFGLDNI